MQKQKSRFIAVEANIAAGKSTLLPDLVSALNHLRLPSEARWVQLQEPVDDPKFAQLLKAFYANPNCTKTRLDFQMYITERRSEMVKMLDTELNYVIERSLFSDLIFSQANFLSMECPEGHYLQYYYDIKRRLTEYPFVEKCVYLRTDPKVALSRVAQRARGAESEIPLDYMIDIHNFHEACLPQICREYGAELLTYEWDCFGDPFKLANDILRVKTLP